MTKCFEIEKVYTSDLLIAQVKHGVCLTLCYDFFVRELFVSRSWKPLTKGKWRKGKANTKINLTLLNLSLVQ